MGYIKRIHCNIQHSAYLVIFFLIKKGTLNEGQVHPALSEILFCAMSCLIRSILLSRTSFQTCLCQYVHDHVPSVS